MTANFDDTFKELTGHPPYPWQRRLYVSFVEGEKVDALDIPTGLGKTSVMAIWLLAHLLGEAKARPPMRLIYVVNRRTIVDQATDIAVKLQDKVKILQQWKDQFQDSPLCVSTLRGALADKGDWLLSPHRPAIVVGTVDMIGSRLLFNGYRAGRWQRSRHAGLLGQDALLVHDEAHLSKPFQTMLEWVIQQQNGQAGGLRIMPMSATAGRPDQDKVLQIDFDDRQIAKDKLQAVKRVRLQSVDGKSVPVRLAELAHEHNDQCARVIIFTRLPDQAAKVVEGLKKKKVPDERIALLTGTIRGYERDQLVKQQVLKNLLESNKPIATEYLVATSAGEVGADFDADHIVCDLSTIDAMIQRFGRVNRRGGEGRKATIDILLDTPAAKKDKGDKAKKLSPIESARVACADFLEALKKEQNDGFDASPEAIGNWRERPGYKQACEPSVPTITPHDVVLDAWSLTSIQENWPLAHDVAPYLHGLEDSQPQTFVAWRAELDVWNDSENGDLDDQAVNQLLSHYPLRPRELLHDKPEMIADMLVSAQKRVGDARVVLIRNRQVSVRQMNELTENAKQLVDDIRYCTVILPTSAGGLSDKGLIDKDHEGSVLDVADKDAEPDDRRRVILDRNEDGEWAVRVLGEENSATEKFARWTAARDAMGKTLKMRYVGRLVLSLDVENQPRRLLLLYVKSSENTDNSPHKLTISTHNQNVDEKVWSVIGKIQLGETEKTALSLAARHHDLGKGWDGADGRWQKAVGNASRDEAWAKTFKVSPNWKLLDGYRHEFGSLLLATQSKEGFSSDESIRDLALHLIAVHHGRGRPHFELPAMKTPPDKLPDELKPAEIARRFDRLQRRYGHWGLAWLESLLMAADAEASQNAKTTADEDQDEGQKEDQ